MCVGVVVSQNVRVVDDGREPRLLVEKMGHGEVVGITCQLIQLIHHVVHPGERCGKYERK